MPLTDFDKQIPMSEKEAMIFDLEKGVAKKTDRGVIEVPISSQIAVADEGPDAKLQTTETKLLDVALPFIEQGVPKSLVRGLIAFANNTINAGKDAGVVLESLKSTLELIKGLLPDPESSKPEETSPPSLKHEPNMRTRISGTSRYSTGLSSRTSKPPEQQAA